MANYRASYTSREKREFAQRLKKAMLDQGLQGAALARRASKYREGEMPRQLVSAWINGHSIPDELNLNAIEKALDVPKDYLLPRPHALAPGEPDTTPAEPEQDVRYSIVEGGLMKLNITAAVPREIGQQILALLQKAGH